MNLDQLGLIARTSRGCTACQEKAEALEREREEYQILQDERDGLLKDLDMAKTEKEAVERKLDMAKTEKEAVERKLHLAEYSKWI